MEFKILIEGISKKHDLVTEMGNLSLEEIKKIKETTDVPVESWRKHRFEPFKYVSKLWTFEEVVNSEKLSQVFSKNNLILVNICPVFFHGFMHWKLVDSVLIYTYDEERLMDKIIQCLLEGKTTIE